MQQSHWAKEQFLEMPFKYCAWCTYFFINSGRTAEVGLGVALEGFLA